MLCHTSLCWPILQPVRAGCCPLQGTPQCFLLTPKLLPNLPFSADCTVLSIINGPLLSRLALPFNKACPACHAGLSAHPAPCLAALSSSGG